MRFGFVLPGGSPPEQLDLGVAAEEAGWDGLFVWEGAYANDPWTVLGALAARTSRIRLGTMLTPLPWRRPWKLAAQVATLDQLSGGRAILTVGLGAVDPALGTYGEETDRRVRAERLDEGLAAMEALWRNEAAFRGRHVQFDRTKVVGAMAALRPVREPRPTVWVVGAWNRDPSMRRALRCDGIVPTVLGAGGGRVPSAEELAAMVGWIGEQRGSVDGFDLVMEGETPGDDPAAARAIVEPYARAGCTWWLDAWWRLDGDDAARHRALRERIELGPPSLSG